MSYRLYKYRRPLLRHDFLGDGRARCKYDGYTRLSDSRSMEVVRYITVF